MHMCAYAPVRVHKCAPQLRDQIERLNEEKTIIMRGKHELEGRVISGQVCVCVCVFVCVCVCVCVQTKRYHEESNSVTRFPGRPYYPRISSYLPIFFWGGEGVA